MGKEETEGARPDPGSLGIQGPDVSLHLTRPHGHADAVLL